MTNEEKKAKSEKYKQWRDANKDKLNAKARENHAANKEKINAKKRALYEENKTKLEEKRKLNREHNNARKRELYEANKKQINEKKAEYRSLNREKFRKYSNDWYQLNKEIAQQRNKSWKESNPEKIASYVRNRQAAKIQRTPNWLTSKDFRAIELMYGKAKKLEEKTGIKHHVDHIIPLRGKNVSGLHVPANLQIISAADNVRKGNRYQVNA